MARVIDQRYPIPVYIAPASADSSTVSPAGTVPTKNPSGTVGSTSGLVIKNSAGTLYGINASSTAACYLVLLNATTIPTGGAAIDPVKVFAVPANGAVTYDWINPIRFTTGIVAVLTTTLATFTASATGTISGEVR